MSLEEKQIGKRAKPFDYSGKTIIAIKVENQNIINEIERVRKLPAGGTWVQDPQAKGTVYKEEPTLALPKIGYTYENCFLPTGSRQFDPSKSSAMRRWRKFLKQQPKQFQKEN
jgi:hypothetical protein